MLIIIWEVVYRVGVEYLQIWKPYMFPSPITVIKTLFDLIKDNTLGVAILASMKRIIVGYSISLLIGVAIGLTIVRFKYLDENLSPVILGLQTLPSICWLPFAILWFGLNESAIIFVITIGSTFAISLAIVSGIKNVNPLYLRAAKTMGASGFNVYKNVTIPASLPSVISGMKQGWSFAWRALMAAELLSPKNGLGYALTIGRDLQSMDQVVGVMIIIIAIGLLIDKLIFGRLEYSIRYRWGLTRA